MSVGYVHQAKFTLKPRAFIRFKEFEIHTSKVHQLNMKDHLRANLKSSDPSTEFSNKSE